MTFQRARYAQMPKHRKRTRRYRRGAPVKTGVQSSIRIPRIQQTNRSAFMGAGQSRAQPNKTRANDDDIEIRFHSSL
jgi:hypothetical protein